MLGFDVSERTVLRWMQRAPRSPEPAKRWAAFLSNHREAIAAMDLFTVPTLTFGVLYCFFVIAHDRRRILHCNVTRHPNSTWTMQRLREAFPCDSSPKYLIFSLIGLRASIKRSSVPSRRWALSQSKPVSEVRGRTALQNAGLETVEEISSII